jgi:hypothetical protein
MTRVIAALVLLVGAIVSSACAADETGNPDRQQFVGVVTAVEGNLQRIDEFEILLSDGSTMVVVPADGLTFEGGPLAHIQDHLRSGEPVRLTVDRADGAAVVYEIGDSE